MKFLIALLTIASLARAELPVRAICEDHDGNIRAATLRGLSSINAAGSVSTMNFGIGTVANSLKGVCGFGSAIGVR